MTQMSLLNRIDRVVRAFAGLVASVKAPKAYLNLQALNSLLQTAADDHLAQMFAETREKLRAGVTGVVAKTAPGAVPEIADDLEVMLYVVMNDPTLRAQLNAAAKKAGIKDAIAYLRAALLAADVE